MFYSYMCATNFLVRDVALFAKHFCAIFSNQNWISKNVLTKVTDDGYSLFFITATDWAVADN